MSLFEIIFGSTHTVVLLCIIFAHRLSFSNHYLIPLATMNTNYKNKIQQWINKYVATLSPEADATKVDMDATRQALLSEKPIDRDESRQFWNNVRSESEAELFLQDYRAKAQEQLSSLLETKSSSHLSLTDEETALLSKLQDVLSVPYERQLRKLVNMGTLRPMLDEYTHEKDRQRFFEKYSSIFLEGLEMEHLVPDPEGPIGLDDLSSDLRDELSGEWSPSISSSGSLPAALSSSSDQEPRFAIRMIAYGTDEFGSERAGRARDLYRLWNEHKANRAKFEEAMFKKGLMGLEQTRVRSSSGKKGKGFHKK